MGGKVNINLVNRKKNEEERIPTRAVEAILMPNKQKKQIRIFVKF